MISICDSNSKIRWKSPFSLVRHIEGMSEQNRPSALEHSLILYFIVRCVWKILIAVDVCVNFIQIYIELSLNADLWFCNVNTSEGANDMRQVTYSS